jgi:hypothetical protein
MDFIKPEFPKDMIDKINKAYPQNCFGCEHFRSLPDKKTNICLKDGKMCKVDAFNPVLTNPSCKFNATGSPFSYGGNIDRQLQK